MTSTQVEYMGFATNGSAREYKLRIRHATGDTQVVIVVIPSEAFLAHRVRYQDAPEICFLKLQREVTASAEGLPAHVTVTDADMLEYVAAHAPKPPKRRPRPPIAT